MKKLLMIAVPGLALLAMAFTAPGDVVADPDGMYWTVKSTEGFSPEDSRDLREAIAQIYGVDANGASTLQMMDGSAIGYAQNCQLDQSLNGQNQVNIYVSRSQMIHTISNMSVQEADIRRILSKYSN